jgi:Tfp pilus assembly protein PilF
LSSALSAADSARAAYERALQLDPQSPVAATRLARSYVLVLERGGQIPTRTTEAAMNRVLGLLTGALAADSMLSEAWTVRAMLARLRDPIRFVDAAAAHARAIKVGSNDADAEHEYGETLMRLGDDRGAEAHFRRALAIEPNRATTLAAMSELTFRAQRWAESCVLSNASIEVWPYDAESYAVRSRTRMRLGEARDAYSDAETAARLTTGAIWVEALRVSIQVGASNIEGARREARALTGRWLAPGRTLTVRDAQYVALAYVAVGDNRRAVEALKRANPVGADLGNVLREPTLAPIRSDTAVTRLLRQTSASDAKPVAKPKRP